jgi:hypothetical protein
MLANTESAHGHAIKLTYHPESMYSASCFKTLRSRKATKASPE